MYITRTRITVFNTDGQKDERIIMKKKNAVKTFFPETTNLIDVPGRRPYSGDHRKHRGKPGPGTFVKITHIKCCYRFLM